MNFFQQLGVNHTYFYQFAIFVLALVGLSQFVFKPFVELLKEREKKSVGAETVAAEENKKASELLHAYEVKAQSLNKEIRTIFDSYRQEATAEYENIVAQARQESIRLIEETRQRVSVEIGDAARKLKEEVPQVAEIISKRILTAPLSFSDLSVSKGLAR